MKGYTDLSQSKKLAGVEGNSRTIKRKVIMEQPKWCNYPHAASPTFLGCWSLLDGLVKDESYCKDCDRYKQPKGE